MSLAKLLNELQAAETIIKQQAPAAFLVDQAGPSSSKPAKLQKKKKKPRKAVIPGGAKDGVAKPKGKCFHCKQPGHYKKQCPDFQAKMKNKGNSFYPHPCIHIKIGIRAHTFFVHYFFKGINILLFFFLSLTLQTIMHFNSLTDGAFRSGN